MSSIDLTGVPLIEVAQDLYRNVVSLRASEYLFDDLSEESLDQQAAVAAEIAAKPPEYQSPAPVIDRPFEEAEHQSVIEYPFWNFSETRFSSGHFGVWYGSEEIETTVHETVYHWRRHLLGDIGLENKEGMSIERRVHAVWCDASLINLLGLESSFPSLTDNHYGACQALGERLHRQGHPGLWTRSARCQGVNAALLTPIVLSNPRVSCYLTYRIEGGRVVVCREPDKPWLVVN